MKPIKALAVLVAAAAALAGCTAQGTPTPTPTVDSKQDEAAVAGIKWEGGTQSPKLVLTAPLRVSQPTVRSIEPGTGSTIALGQLVTFDTLVVDGETGQTEMSTFGGQSPNQMILASSTANVTMLSAMQSSRVGGKFLYVVPTGDTSTGTQSAPATPGPIASKVIAVSIRSVENVPSEAHGQSKKPVATMPKVTFAADGTPSLVAPKGEQATSLSSEVLIEGTGPKVLAGQTLAVKYYGWLWNGKSFDSAWGADKQPEVISLNEVISGWSKAMVGKTVGSRVLIVVPPAMAYGGAGNEAIPPDATLVFLVDVLAAY